MQALKFFANQKKYFEKMIELSLYSVAKYGGGEDGVSLSSAVVNFILQKDGLQHAREMYKRYAIMSLSQCLWLLPYHLNRFSIGI